MSTKVYRPSNATEGDLFIESQCEACTKVACKLPRQTMHYASNDPRYPQEWVSDADGSNPRCTAREVRP